ncbi:MULTISPECIES: 30S ribosomal protein S9 [Hymenobacter]|jgi:small subunit ribosomal protein S9|uniref:Small ribosomal subunit protein uS9 n=6 Tax=Hymenobacter TaxID=89966 RepID=A0A4Z0PWZ5_9BACT|nr:MULTISPECIES: 30S ribosomal protein S9 [Hymenobacter]MCB2376100.1 30S ribosomal protein S9 [Hymenobacter nitidus]MCB2407160.1 30S ribosomal protein S9 [Hymenobacter lucidus]PJJ54765.1 small subunit ribosomal protein S9 [Hymenobacter chitinivorans DSM 11115]TGE21995.1 30S ribosomal protein S9 [Hymenobacter aquaticus]UOQ53251.1 30S ribosomal protein S9 [Hymenobacter cellulosivorans]
MEISNTSGRRKTSVARIYMQAGQGNITINGREMKAYFGNELLENIVNQPLNTVEQLNQYDIKVNVRGGGISAQAEAIRLAISKALVGDNAEVRPALKKEGFLTRDPRMVERKKFGKRKARRSFQFSKR